MMTAVLCLVAFVDALLVEVGVLTTARRMYRAGAIIAMVNYFLWFAFMKWAIEDAMSWANIPVIAACFGVGSYCAVRWFPK